MLVVKVPFLRRSFSDEYPADLSGSISPAAYNIRINSLKNIAFCQLPSTLLVYGLAAAICIISAMCAVWRYLYTSQEPGFFIALPITWLITLTIVFLWQKKQWHKFETMCSRACKEMNKEDAHVGVQYRMEKSRRSFVDMRHKISWNLHEYMFVIEIDDTHPSRLQAQYSRDSDAVYPPPPAYVP